MIKAGPSDKKYDRLVLRAPSRGSFLGHIDTKRTKYLSKHSIDGALKNFHNRNVNTFSKVQYQINRWLSKVELRVFCFVKLTYITL